MPTIAATEQEIRTELRRLFDFAVASADPVNCLPKHLPTPPKGKTLLVAAGKAAASMARATEQAWPKEANLSGFALTRYNHGTQCDRIEVIEAAHPVPDNRGYEAAKRLLKDVQALGPDDLLLFLVSGGGSALLALPADGISLQEKKKINTSLLMSGAPIGAMNTVRKHMSAIKGGRLAQAAAPARVVTLAISDVPFDDPSTIASGPTVPDATTVTDAKAVLSHYGITAPPGILKHLAKPDAETPKPNDAEFENTECTIVSCPGDMIKSIVSLCSSEGHNVTSLGADLEGEAREVAAHHAKLALSCEPGLIISGGETTVTVDAEQPSGKGGRNCEYLLALAVALDGAPNIYALAADTDGIDGSEDNAGAIVTPDTLKRAATLGLDAQAMLDGHDSYNFFKALDDLVTTGPTLTNVNDFRAIRVG